MCGEENPLICLIYSACSVCQILAQSITSRSCGGERKQNKYNEGLRPGCNKTSQSPRGNLGNGTQNPGAEAGISPSTEIVILSSPHYLLCDELCVFVLRMRRMRMRMRGRRRRGGG